MDNVFVVDDPTPFSVGQVIMHSTGERILVTGIGEKSISVIRNFEYDPLHQHVLDLFSEAER